MTNATKLARLERDLAQISAQQHRLAKAKREKQEQALRLRVSFSASDAEEYQTLVWQRAQGLEAVGR